MNIEIEKPPGALTDVGVIISGIVGWLLLISFILAFFNLISGGLAWLISGGEKTAVEGARNRIIASIIGLIIVVSSWALFSIIGNALGYNFLSQGLILPILYRPQP